MYSPHMNTIGIDLTTRRHHPYGQYRLALDMTCGNHILQLWKDGLQWLQAEKQMIEIQKG